MPIHPLVDEHIDRKAIAELRKLLRSGAEPKLLEKEIMDWFSRFRNRSIRFYALELGTTPVTGKGDRALTSMADNIFYLAAQMFGENIDYGSSNYRRKLG